MDSHIKGLVSWVWLQFSFHLSFRQIASHVLFSLYTLKGIKLHTIGGTKIVRILKSLFKTSTPVAFVTRSPELSKAK